MKKNNYKLKNDRKRNTRLVLLVALLIVTLFAGGLFAYTSMGKSDSDITTGSDTSSEVTNSKSNSVKDSLEKKDSTAKQDSAKFVPKEDETKVFDYVLVTENETYKIRKLDKEYYVTLYAIINRPDQSEMYRDQLRQYKKDALDYLTKQGVDINTARIKYEPEEATNL